MTVEEFEIQGSELVKYRGKGGEVEIPEGIETIASAFAGAKKAFSGCETVTCVVLPKSLKVIGAEAFKGCKNLRTVKYCGTVENWCKIKIGMAGNPLANGAELCCNGEHVEELVIPECVTEIGGGQFEGGLFKSVKIPSTVKSVGIAAFSDCRNLEKLEIAEGLKSIGSHAFSKCEKLKDVILPDGVESLGADCFGWSAGLRYAYIPASVKTADAYTFYNCSENLVVECGAKRRPRGWNRRWNVCEEDRAKRLFSVKRRVKTKWNVKNKI